MTNKGLKVDMFRGKKQQLYNFGTFYFNKLAQSTQTPKQLLVGAEDDVRWDEKTQGLENILSMVLDIRS